MLAVVITAVAAGGAVGSAVVAFPTLRWQKAVARQGVVDSSTARAQTSCLSGMDELASPDRQARRVDAAELGFLSRDQTAGRHALRARIPLDTGPAQFLTALDADLDVSPACWHPPFRQATLSRCGSVVHRTSTGSPRRTPITRFATPFAVSRWTTT